MKINDIIKTILKENGIRKTVLANRLGLDRRVLDCRLRGENMTTKNAVETARALDYKIVVVPVNTNVREGWFEIG